MSKQTTVFDRLEPNNRIPSRKEKRNKKIVTQLI